MKSKQMALNIISVGTKEMRLSAPKNFHIRFITQYAPESHGE